MSKSRLKPITNKSLSPFTVAAYTRTLKAFFSWAGREGYLERNPARLLKVPKVLPKLVQTPTWDPIIRLLAAEIGRISLQDPVGADSSGSASHELQGSEHGRSM